jgi:membrane protein DedA with SNARE-associated domain
MNQIILWLEQYGLAAVFLNIGLEQLGLPIPAYPVLILTGALSFNGQYSAGGLLLTAVLACLIADSIWYWAGHRYGSRVLKTLCRISLSPDSCVRQTESIFTRWGVRSLVLAKFIPGFASLATALAGRTGVPFGRFLFFDAIGATLYAGVGLAIGMVFHDAVADVLAIFEQMGRIGLMVLLVAFALFLAHKWWQRQRFYRQLRMARISPTELVQLTQGQSTHRDPGCAHRTQPGGRRHHSRRAALVRPRPQDGHARPSPRCGRGCLLRMPQRCLGRAGGQAADGGGVSQCPPAARRHRRLAGGRAGAGISRTACVTPGVRRREVNFHLVLNTDVCLHAAMQGVMHRARDLMKPQRPQERS